MRSREVSASRPGGECGVAKVTGNSLAAGGGTKATLTTGTRGGVTTTGSTLTKWRKTLVVQARATGTERLQQLCGAFAVSASNN